MHTLVALARSSVGDGFISRSLISDSLLNVRYEGISSYLAPKGINRYEYLERINKIEATVSDDIKYVLDRTPSLCSLCNVTACYPIEYIPVGGPSGQQ